MATTLTKTIKEIVTDIGGNTTIEFSDDSLQQYNIKDTVTAQTNPVTGGINYLIAAGKAVPVNRPARIKMQSIGHSKLADAYSSGVWTNWGWLAFVRRFLGRNIYFPASSSFAVGGATIDDIINSQLAPAAADDAHISILDPWQNSIGAMTNASIIAKGKQMVDALLLSGKTVVLICPRPTRGVYVRPTAGMQQALAITRWANAYAATVGNLWVYDPSDYYIDFSTGNAQASMLRDGLHDDVATAHGFGKRFAAWLAPRLGSRQDAMVYAGDTYDAANNQGGNLLPNGLFTAAGGGVVNGATGSVASGWTGARTTGAATHTAAFSRTTDAAYPTMTTITVTLGGVGDSHSTFMFAEIDLSATLLAGDQVYAEIEIDYAITSAAFRGFALYLHADDASHVPLVSQWDGYVPTSQGALGVASGSMLLRTEPITIPAGFKYVTVSPFVYPDASGTPAGTVTFKRAALRKVI